MNRFSFNKILYFTEEALKINKHVVTDLLMTQLCKVDFVRFNNDQCKQLIEPLIKLGERADIDLTVINLMFSRPHNFLVTNSHETLKMLELYEMIDKY